MPVSQQVNSKERVPSIRTQVREIADELWMTKGYMSKTKRRKLATALYFLTDELQIHESMLWPVGEDLVFRIQHARMLLKKGDQAEQIAYLLDRPIADVRKVLAE